MTILAATDLSARSDRAIRRAALIARDRQLPLTIVHVLDADLSDEVATPLEAAARERIETLAAGAGAPEVTVQVDRGDVAADLHARARSADATLIVLGMHRVRPFLDLFRETTLERLVRLAERPVLVVRNEVEGAYARVLTAVDFSPGATRAARVAQQIFPDTAMRGFHAVHIPFQGLTDAQGHATDTKFYLGAAQTELASWARQADLAALAENTDIVEGALHAVLARQMAAQSPDLIALGAHGRTGRAPPLLGSFANDLMRDPPCDLLIARG